jgi:hypothetical protein
MGAVFGHDQGLWFGQVEHLPGNVVRGHRGAQRLATPCADSMGRAARRSYLSARMYTE